MKLHKKWQESLGGVPHIFELYRTSLGKKGCLDLYIDGVVALSVQPRWTESFSGADYPFTFNGYEMRLIIAGANGNAELVVDGHNLSTGKPYKPQPKWVWIFAVQVFVLGYMGGILGALCGIGGALIGYKVARSNMNTVVRLLICLVIIALSWLAYLIFAVAFAGLMNSI